MTFLPIVGRELRVTARRHATFSTRVLVAVGAILVGFFLFFASLGASTQTVAERIFQGLSGLALLYCLVAGRRWTADCLSGEKRDGTLGLLFLTDLKGHDVVLGKLAATSLSGFYGLLAMVPVLAVPLLLGGLTQGEFWRLVLVLVNTFLFSLAVGIFVSAATQDSRRAFGANFLVLLLISAFPPACAGAIAYFSPTHHVVAPLLYSCPAYSLFVSYESHYRWEAGHFWCSVAITHALTWLLVGLACWLVPRSWQDRPGEAGVIGCALGLTARPQNAGRFANGFWTATPSIGLPPGSGSNQPWCGFASRCWRCGGFSSGCALSLAGSRNRSLSRPPCC
jgi:ABC-type transport system involved in cytochrome c biogenesis permease component